VENLDGWFLPESTLVFCAIGASSVLIIELSELILVPLTELLDKRLLSDTVLVDDVKLSAPLNCPTTA
jgi:hypothetical protein